MTDPSEVSRNCQTVLLIFIDMCVLGDASLIPSTSCRLQLVPVLRVLDICRHYSCTLGYVAEILMRMCRECLKNHHVSMSEFEISTPRYSS